MGVHEGHRGRLRSRFTEYGLDNFNELNALELLLFYSIPRRDTNAIAHALLDYFGSLSAVFEASQQELLAVEGVGENTATLIRLVPQIYKKAVVAKTSEIRAIVSTSDAGDYLLPRFMNERDEVLLLMCLDSRRHVLSCTEIGRGVVNGVDTSLRRIVETALKNKSSYVIIAHNHPDGVALPSREDDVVTKQVFDSLATVGIKLLDHIVVAGDDYVSYKDSGIINLFRY